MVLGTRYMIFRYMILGTWMKAEIDPQNPEAWLALDEDLYVEAADSCSGRIRGIRLECNVADRVLWLICAGLWFMYDYHNWNLGSSIHAPSELVQLS